MGLHYKKGRLHFGEGPFCDLDEVAQKVSTPFYIYDLDGIQARVRALKAAYPPLQIHYALKANGSSSVLAAIKSEGVGVDVVSGGEIRTALGAGFVPSDIIFSGVGKTRLELESAIGLGIKQINVESPQELVRIMEVAKALSKKPKIAFRLNPDVDAKTHPYITTGFRENKFGMDEAFFPELKEILRAKPDLVELRGLTMHIGSQLSDLSPIEDAIRLTRKAFDAFRAEGFPLRTLDVGGGIGIPYREEHRLPSKDFDTLKEYGSLLSRALKDFSGEVLCEPGRILVGSAGALCSTIQYVKNAPHRNFLVMDTGIHHLLRPALYQAHHRVMPFLESTDRRKVKYDVVGPICESSDVLGKDRELPEMKQGELLAIADAGAYGFSMASHYNEHEFPKEVVWKRGTWSVPSR